VPMSALCPSSSVGSTLHKVFTGKRVALVTLAGPPYADVSWTGRCLTCLHHPQGMHTTSGLWQNHASLQEPLSQVVISLDLYWTTCGMNSYQTSCALPAVKCPVIHPQRPKLELVACIAFGLVCPHHPGIKRGLAIPAWQVWNLEGMRAGSPPPLVRNLKPFAANQKMPEAEITCIALHEASWPRITIAVGLATSQIYILRGSSGKPTWLGRLCYLHNCRRT